MKQAYQPCIRCEKAFFLPNTASKKAMAAPMCRECMKATEAPRSNVYHVGIRKTDARDEVRP